MTMPNPFEFAQREHDHPSRNWHNRCGEFTRTAFGRPSVGDFDGDGAADAEDQWKAARFKHPETDPMKIPRGVPVYWSGGSADNGHAAGPSRGDGTVWGTDLVRDGHVDVYRISDVQAKWGLTLLGWTEDIGGVRVWTPPAAPKPAPAAKPAAPKRRPKNVRAAIVAALRARRNNAKAGNTAEVRRLDKALAWLRKFPRK